MNPLLFLKLANLFFAGMLAGIETGVHYGLGAPPPALGEPSQIQLRQGWPPSAGSASPNSVARSGKPHDDHRMRS
jgi:hypothetical protein